MSNNFQVEDLQAKRPGDYFYYRPATKTPNNYVVRELPGEDDIQFHNVQVTNQELSKQLLFIHMSQAQRYLFNR